MSVEAPSERRPLIGLLLRVKARSLSNRAKKAMDEAPIRLSITVLLVGFIWFALYFMFKIVFRSFERTPLEATVALPLIFNFFFMAMLAMLTFSNAIIAYGALFGKNESAYLLTSPLTPLDVVTLKYIESLVMASWALVLLGLPLMVSMARLVDHSNRILFFCLYIAFFLAFIPIPGALGLFIAWLAARAFPRRATRAVSVLVGVAILVLVIWGMRSLQTADDAMEAWLRNFQARMRFLRAAFLPNYWVASGIDHAIRHQFFEAFMYLGVTIANACFLSWAVVRFVARYFDGALDRAMVGRGDGIRYVPASGWGVAGWLFFYLPKSLRTIATKDLRVFMRDPLQWSQLAILFGLLFLYLSNMPTLRIQLSGAGWRLMMPFMNLCAVSLILATFTCRFVFPLISLEGRKLWLIGLLPMKRSRVLWAKFAFAMTITLAVAMSAMTMSLIVLKMNLFWSITHIVVIASICFGLCGISVGLGARLPMYDELNAARIANGLGGTTNLLASIAMVAVVLTGVGIATWQSRHLSFFDTPEPSSIVLCFFSVLTSAIVGLVALRLGGDHFAKAEV